MRAVIQSNINSGLLDEHMNGLVVGLDKRQLEPRSAVTEFVAADD